MAQSHMVTKAAQYTHDYYYAITRGYQPLPPLADGTEQFSNAAVPGACPFSGFGERVTSGAVVNGFIWPNGAVYIPPAAGVQPSLSSASANDTAAGTGIQVVDVHYLDHLLVPKVESVTLNGVSAVPMVATDVRWIQCMHATRTGSGLAAAAAISALSGANTLSIISAADIRCRSSLRMVPKGKVAFLLDAVGGAISGIAAAEVHIEVVSTELEGEQYTQQQLFFARTEVAMQDGSSPIPVELLKFREGTLIGMTFTTDKPVTVTGTWRGWLEDA